MRRHWKPILAIAVAVCISREEQQARAVEATLGVLEAVDGA